MFIIIQDVDFWMKLLIPSASHFSLPKLRQGFPLTSLTPISLLLVVSEFPEDAICVCCPEVLSCWQPMPSPGCLPLLPLLGHSCKSVAFEYGGFISAPSQNQDSTCLFLDLSIALDWHSLQMIIFFLLPFSAENLPLRSDPFPSMNCDDNAKKIESSKQTTVPRLTMLSMHCFLLRYTLRWSLSVLLMLVDLHNWYVKGK